MDNNSYFLTKEYHSENTATILAEIFSFTTLHMFYNDAENYLNQSSACVVVCHPTVHP